MAANRFASGSVSGYIPPTSYEVMEEVYDESYEPTQEDVIEQCFQMGIDPVKEIDLVYIAVEALKAPLPESWRPISDGKGGYFYHNFATGQSTWEHPCDQFYLKMLDQEREKQAFRAAAETNVRPSTSHGRQSSGAAVARVPGMGTKNAPALGPVKPQLPSSLSIGSSSLKKPSALAPIGEIKKGGGGGGGFLSDLPPLSLPLGPLKPTLEPVKTALPPPVVMATEMGMASTNNATPTKKDDKAKEVKKNQERGGGGSAGGLGSNLKHFPLRGLDLNISTEFKDEEEEEEEEEENSSDKSDGNDFAKRFNIKGLDDDYTTSTSHESHPKEKEREEEEGEKEEEEKVPLVKGNTTDDDDEDNTDETNETHPAMVDFLSPSNKPLLPPTLPPVTSLSSSQAPPLPAVQAPPSFMQPPLASSLALPLQSQAPPLQSQAPPLKPQAPPLKPQAPPLKPQAPPLKPQAPPIHSGPTTAETVKGRADLERNHYNTIERLREEHAKELLKLMEQFDSELEEKKKALATENEAKLTEEREKREAEFTRRKTQLEEEHDTALDLLRREYREKEEDEEARLEENKQTVLRNMKKKIDMEQLEQEKQLKSKRDAELKELNAKLEEEMRGEEEKLRKDHDDKMAKLRQELENEREEKRKEMTKTNNQEIESIKEQLQADLNKMKEELEAENKKTLDSMRETLTQEHEENLQTLRSELQKDFESKQSQLEEQKTLQLAIEEEASSRLEERKKQLKEEHETAQSALLVSQEEELNQLRLKHERELEEERQSHEEALVREREEHEDALRKLKARHQEELERERERHEAKCKSEGERETEPVRERNEIKKKKEENETLTNGETTLLLVGERYKATNIQQMLIDRETTREHSFHSQDLLSPLPPPPLLSSSPTPHTAHITPHPPPVNPTAPSLISQAPPPPFMGASPPLPASSNDESKDPITELLANIKNLHAAQQSLLSDVTKLKEEKHRLLNENSTLLGDRGVRSPHAAKIRGGEEDIHKMSAITTGGKRGMGLDTVGLVKGGAEKKGLHVHTNLIPEKDKYRENDGSEDDDDSTLTEGDTHQPLSHPYTTNVDCPSLGIGGGLLVPPLDEGKGRSLGGTPGGGERDALFDRIKLKLDKEAEAIKLMEIKLRQGDKKMKAFSSKLVKETQNIEKEDEESIIEDLTLINDSSFTDTTTPTWQPSPPPPPPPPPLSLLEEDHSSDTEHAPPSPSYASTHIASLRSQLIKEGLLQGGTSRSRSSKTRSHTRSHKSHAHARRHGFHASKYHQKPRSRSTQTRFHSPGSRSRTPDSRPRSKKRPFLRIEDLQDSSGVSSSSELSGTSTSCLETVHPPPHVSHDIVSCDWTKDGRRYNGPSVSIALKKINNRLEEVLDCLNERESPLLLSSHHRQRDTVTPSLYSHPHSVPRSPSPVSPSPPPPSSLPRLSTEPFPSHLDVTLQEKWRQKLDAAASKEEESNLMVGPRWAGSLPLSSSKLGREGRHLIQKHRDWLGEFRRSLPRQL